MDLGAKLLIAKWHQGGLYWGGRADKQYFFRDIGRFGMCMQVRFTCMTVRRDISFCVMVPAGI